MRYHSLRATRRWPALALCALVALVAACGNSTTTPPTPVVLQRGTWLRPALPGVSLPTVSAVAFADGDQQVGYACTATLTTTSGTPTATGTATDTATDTATATATATGVTTQPTPLPGLSNVINAFWRTSDGGLSWQQATLPTVKGMLCPISAVVAPDHANSQDVFLLAGMGNVDLQNPTGLLPGQLQYQLWRSQDGGQTWAQLTMPVAPNPLEPTVISPYHLVLLVNGQTLVFASNDSGFDALFVSHDGGQTWQSHTGADLTGDSAFPDTHTFAGFAAGAGGSLLALATSPTLTTTDAPLEIWQSADDGATWSLVSDPSLNAPLGADAHAQLFTAPNGNEAFLLVNNPASAPTVSTATPTPSATGTVTPGPQTTMLLASTDNGHSWLQVGWPSSPTVSGALAGSAIIAELGLGFAVDANGVAYIAPTNSDASLSVDPSANLSAGFFAISHASGAWAVVTVAQPPTPSNSAIGLAVSLVPATELTPTPSGSVTASATSTSTATPTATATGTATATATSTPAPVSGLPTLWANFGPLQQFEVNPASGGFFFDILP